MATVVRNPRRAVDIDDNASVEDLIPAVVVLQGVVMPDGQDLTLESILC